MKRKFNKYYFLALVATLLLIFINEVNSNYLDNTDEYRFDLIQTADESSYLVPPKNFIEKGVWKDNSIGNAAYFQRPPGYGIFFLLSKLILGKYALLGLKIIQVALFFCSILVFKSILLHWRLNEKWTFIATCIFGLLPCYSGFIYYTLTESITPFFLLWSILELSKSHQNEQQNWKLFLSISMLLLIRPQVAFIPIVFLVYFVIKRNFRGVKWILFACLPLFLWYVRAGIIEKSIPSTHPIYSFTNNHLYRPTHQSMTDLFRIWESKSDVFHTYIGQIAYGDSTSIESVLLQIPQEYRTTVKPILHDFQELQRYKQTHFSDSEISGPFAGELDFIVKVDDARNKLISENRFDYYLKTPMKSAYELFRLSHLNLYIFQLPFRGTFWMELLRFLCFSIISLSFILASISLIKAKSHSFQFVLMFAIGTFLFYLIYVQRLNEDRYVYPVLGVYLLLAVFQMEVLLTKNAPYQNQLD